MFALVAALENLTEDEMLLPLEDKMGLVILHAIHVKSFISISRKVMEHAGVAITITTFTDLVSFTIASFSTKVFFVRLFPFSTNKMKRWCHCLFLEPFATMRSWAWPLSTSTCAPSSSPPSPSTRRGSRLAGGLRQYDMILRS